MNKLRLASFLTAAFVSIAAVASASGSTVSKKNCTARPLFKMKSYTASSSPTGYSPSQIKTAYGMTGGTATGKGKTIAIVTAYGDPDLKNDIAAFDRQYGLADADLTVHDCGVNGSDTQWAVESALDTEWAHAMAPGAKLLVVEAASDDSDDILTAVKYATDSGAQIVTMSWGSNEVSSLNSYDSIFSDNSNIVFLAAAGDDGAGAIWPASSPNVIAVGGTTLALDANGNRKSETAWSGSGGGTSFIESEPAWQRTFGIASATRATPDVSFDADPATGVSVYCGVDNNGSSGWYRVGGTSLGAPSWAGIIADLNQTTAYIKNAGSFYVLAGGTSYLNTGNCFIDITSGSNGLYDADIGYDQVTGLGSPQVNSLAVRCGADAAALSNVTSVATSTTTRSSSGSIHIIHYPVRQPIPVGYGGYGWYYKWPGGSWSGGIYYGSSRSK